MAYVLQLEQVHRQAGALGDLSEVVEEFDAWLVSEPQVRHVAPEMAELMDALGVSR